MVRRAKASTIRSLLWRLLRNQYFAYAVAEQPAEQLVQHWDNGDRPVVGNQLRITLLEDNC